MWLQRLHSIATSDWSLPGNQERFCSFSHTGWQPELCWLLSLLPPAGPGHLQHLVDVVCKDGGEVWPCVAVHVGAQRSLASVLSVLHVPDLRHAAARPAGTQRGEWLWIKKSNHNYSPPCGGRSPTSKSSALLQLPVPAWQQHLLAAQW